MACDGQRRRPVSAVKPRILCVDDEQHVLDGLSRVLRRDFEIVTANGGGPALHRLQDRPGYAVIVTDMRMPGINGTMVLKAAREQMPDATRLLLTGQADVKDAMAAINDGQVFRFLTKPCNPKDLEAALLQAVEQYDLRIAQRQLLEETLTGSVQALIEVLALANPVAFGRAGRVRQLMASLGRLIGFRDLWQMEMAAMLSQIGVIMLPGELARRLYDGDALTPAEEESVRRMPREALRVLAGIPRLDEIRGILAAVEIDFADPVAGGDALPIGARMLRVILDFDRLLGRGRDGASALAELGAATGRYDPAVIADLATVLGGETIADEPYLEIQLSEVKEGMVFMTDVRTTDGTLLIARQQKATAALLERISDYWRNIEPLHPVRVAPPVELSVS